MAKSVGLLVASAAAVLLLTKKKKKKAGSNNGSVGHFLSKNVYRWSPGQTNASVRALSAVGSVAGAPRVYLISTIPAMTPEAIAIHFKSQISVNPGVVFLVGDPLTSIRWTNPDAEGVPPKRILVRHSEHTKMLTRTVQNEGAGWTAFDEMFGQLGLVAPTSVSFN